MGAQTYLPIEILDYVDTHVAPQESPFGISQRELAKALGYHPCSMSRPLASLVGDGFLTKNRGLVREGVRKQLTYRITEPGRTRLRRETREVPLLSGDIPPPPHPFLGRKDELAELASFARSSGITFLDGPPGMGKTALISRHLRSVKRGRVPFWFTVRPASSPRQFVGSLTHALSNLGAQQLSYYSQLPRAPVAREVADLVARSLGDRSLAAVIDDVQMAGPDMKEFLASFTHYLAGRGDHLFYLVSQVEPAFEVKGVNAHHLSIGGLDRAAAHDLTDRKGGLADRFESVYQSTLGSPLLLELAVSNPDVEADAVTLPDGRCCTAFDRRYPGCPSGRPRQRADSDGIRERHRRDPSRAFVRTGENGSPSPNPPRPGRGASGGQDSVTRPRCWYRTCGRPMLVSRCSTPGAIDPTPVRERFLHLVEGESWKAAAQLLGLQESTLLRLGYSETLRNALSHLSNVLPRGQNRAPRPSGRGHAAATALGLLRRDFDVS